MNIRLTAQELLQLINVDPAMPDFTEQGALAIIEFYEEYGDSMEEEQTPTIHSIRYEFTEYGTHIWRNFREFIAVYGMYYNDSDDEYSIKEVAHRIVQRITDEGTMMVKELNNGNIIITNL